MTRTCAAAVLVMTLLASQASAFACLAECEPAEAARASAQARPAAAEGSCHRAIESTSTQDVTRLTSAPHDCASHAPESSSLWMPKPSSAASLRLVPLVFVVAAAPLISSGPRFSQVAAALQDLAPPGRPPALTAPLRI